MGPLDFLAFIPLGEEVIKLQMTKIKFIFLLIIMIHSFLCGANTTRRLTNISLTTSPHFFTCIFFKRLWEEEFDFNISTVKVSISLC